MRLTIHMGGDAVTLKIEGKLSGPHVPEAHRAWRELAAMLEQKRLLVDLRGLLYVDKSGQSLLADMHTKAAAEFLADTPLTKYFAEQAQQKLEEI